jgi:hypothetical protein
MHDLRRRALLALAFAAALGTSGCSTAQFQQNGHCALIGGGVGTAVGLGVAIIDEEDTGVVIASGAAGAAIGALAGYGFCVLIDSRP